MGRASAAAAAQSREEILDVAARLLKERGLGGVSIPEIMSAAGLTHGGFYRHFESKEDLAGEAIERAFEVQRDFLGRLSDVAAGDHPTAIAALRDRYLAPEHRDDRGTGCPMAALGGDIARTDAKSPLRIQFTEGTKKSVALLERLGDLEADSSAEQSDAALVTLALLVGANVLARATAGDPISDRIVEVVRQSMITKESADADAAARLGALAP